MQATRYRCSSGSNTLMPETITVYFDYLCPFAWRGAELTEMIAEPLGLIFHWHHFSLYQSNYAGGDWQIWNDPIDHQDEGGSKGLLPFLASCAAKRQGAEAFDSFRLTLLRARHLEHRPLTYDTILEVAEQVSLHVPTFKQELANPECRTTLAHDYYLAKAHHVFGTPTFQFASGDTAYFRIAELPKTVSEATNLFHSYKQLLETFPYLQTIKRPRAPRN
jgi:predicted DsbA family dithiol-disulfide isomerase